MLAALGRFQQFEPAERVLAAALLAGFFGQKKTAGGACRLATAEFLRADAQ
jgi:hypothetical protein